MEVGAAWKPTRGIVVFSKADGVIPYEQASLHAYLLRTIGATAFESFELPPARGPNAMQMNHMGPLTSPIWQVQYVQIVTKLKQMLSIGPPRTLGGSK
jgi:hypothetical protein